MKLYTLFRLWATVFIMVALASGAFGFYQITCTFVVLSVVAIISDFLMYINEM